MADLLVGPFYASCLLLAAAGGAKAFRPGDTATALRIGGLNVPTWTIRAAGAAEAVLGLVAMAIGQRQLAAAVALSYLAFTLFVLWARRAGTPLSSCGCFGKVDTPPTMGHVVVNLALAAVAVGATILPSADLATVLGTQPLAGLPLAVLSGVAASGLYLMLGPAAQLQRVRHPGLGGSS